MITKIHNTFRCVTDTCIIEFLDGRMCVVDSEEIDYYENVNKEDYLYMADLCTRLPIRRSKFREFYNFIKQK